MYIVALGVCLALGLVAGFFMGFSVSKESANPSFDWGWESEFKK